MACRLVTYSLALLALACARSTAVVDYCAHEDQDANTVHAAERLVREFEQVLGPPRAAVRICVGSSARPSSCSDTVPFPAALTDVGALRECVRTWTPAWYGASPEHDGPARRTTDSWFLAGLSEVLAYRLPVEAGLHTRDWRSSLEVLWVRDSLVQQIDVRIGRRGRVAESARERRMVCAIYVHALLHDPRADLGLSAWLADYDGAGLPDEPGLDAPVGRFVARYIDTPPGERPPMWFESDWILRVHRKPASGADLGDDFLAVAFTSDTRGLLGLCSCKMAPSGGVSRRDFALQALRDRFGPICLFDLGAFSNTDSALEHDFYVERLAIAGYDAVVLDPFDFYADAFGRRAAWATPPYVACGTTLDGRAGLAPSVIVERSGLRVAFIGASELLECRGPQRADESRLAGVTFPRGPGSILAEARRIESSVDLIIVGGSLHPSTVRALCADGSVDAVLVGGSSGTSAPRLGYIGDTLVAGSTTRYGVDVLELHVADGRIVLANARSEPLRENDPVDVDTELALELLARGPRPK